MYLTSAALVQRQQKAIKYTSPAWGGKAIECIAWPALQSL
jgi:hypothetical protein